MKVKIALTETWLRTEQYTLLNLSNGNRLTLEEDVTEEQDEWTWCIFLNIESRTRWFKQPVKYFEDRESAAEYFEKMAAKIGAVEI